MAKGHAEIVGMRLQRRFMKEGLRFLVGGGLNTAFSLAMYWLLLKAFPYGTAYTISYALGIVASYLLNSLFVFRTQPSIRSALAFPLVYLVQYAVGLAVLWLWVSRLHLPQSLGAVAVVALTLPLTFFLSRRVLGAARNQAIED